MKAKYVSRKERKGRIVWVVNPPQTWKETVHATYMQFDNVIDAQEYSRELQRDFNEYERREKFVPLTDQRTVDGIIARYKATTDYKRLADNSKRAYITMLDQASDWYIGGSKTRFGDMMARTVSSEHADQLYQEICEHVSDHRGEFVVKVLRKVWFSAFRAGRVTGNPFSKMNLVGLPSREHRWTEEQVRQFIDTADAMNRSSVGTLALLCYDLCQRPGDMLKLTPENLFGDVMMFVQEKTGTPMEVPVSPRLLERLQLSLKATDQPFVVYEATNRPYTDRHGYNKVVRKVKARAGLPKELQIRDLRRSGATLLGESGCTYDELRAVTGHKDPKVLQTYVKTTQTLAGNAMRKRFADDCSR
jgi:integrase